MSTAGGRNRATWFGLFGAIVLMVVGSLIVGCSTTSEAGSSPSRSDHSSKAASTSTDTSTSTDLAGRDGASVNSSDTANAPDHSGAGTGVQTGSINEVEHSSPAAPVRAPVGLNEVADFGNGVTARLSKVDNINVVAKLPGEMSGPAVRVTIELDNSSHSPLNLDSVSVVPTDPTGVPVPPITSQKTVPFRGELAPGSTASGTYVFILDPADRADASLSVKYASNQPAVVFTGDFPNA